ncbi:MAG: hypoxanthine phosphoribosyltransferase [Ardenticatenales bacterium]|nr:hypoxanthine phosphoribosyltransferase [Ardenticatenales bacterium]
MDPLIDRVLIDEAQLDARVTAMAAQISAHYQAQGNLVLVGILKGSFIFMADLARRLTIPHRIEFMALSSYGDLSTSSGEVRMMLDLRRPVAGEHVLLVEDIVDTGLTLQYLIENFRARHALSVANCVLLSKPERRKVQVQVDYLGFEIPDVWVVGYGLDYAERFRTLPYIGVLSPSVYLNS